MRKLVTYILMVCGILTMAVAAPENKASDSYIRDRVVMLKSEHGQCSGVEVRGKSGKPYILTAAHCALLIEYGTVNAIYEDGDSDYVEFVAIDPAHDLMLLTSLDDNSVEIADNISPHEKVHSLTHGHGFPTYRTDGELLMEVTGEVAVFPIHSQEDMDTCPTTAYQKVVEGMFEAVCVRTLTLMGTTAMIVPGSSGGPVLNAAGQLVGIVSAGDGTFGYLVPLRSIKRFLKSH